MKPPSLLTVGEGALLCEHAEHTLQGRVSCPAAACTRSDTSTHFHTTSWPMVHTKLGHDMCPPALSFSAGSGMGGGPCHPRSQQAVARGVCRYRCEGVGVRRCGEWGVGMGLPPSPSLPPGAESALLSTVGQDTHECSCPHTSTACTSSSVE